MTEGLPVLNWSYLHEGELVDLVPLSDESSALRETARAPVRGAFVRATYNVDFSCWQAMFLIDGAADMRFISTSWNVFRACTDDAAAGP